MCFIGLQVHQKYIIIDLYKFCVLSNFKYRLVNLGPDYDIKKLLSKNI